MYGFKSRAGQSKTMNPKLYSEIANKFSEAWGPYAGWAHSVSTQCHYPQATGVIELVCFQVLFTADLKSFASFGLEPSAAAASTSTTLPLPSPAPVMPDVNPLDEDATNGIATKAASKPRGEITRFSCAIRH